MTNEFRVDHTTLRAIGGGTNSLQTLECMSQDQGAVSAGFTNNFAFANLILGQTGAGATSIAFLALGDAYDNNRSDANPEVVYVTNLKLYANSILYLNGFKLYHKTSGSWQAATVGNFSYGDGSGRIAAQALPQGTYIDIN